MRVTATAKAYAILDRVREAGRRDLVMVIGTGCCDSTAPFLFDHYLPEPDAQRVGSLGEIEVLASAWLAKLYQDEDELVVDVDENVVNDSFSLESEYDCRFTLRVPQKPEQR